MTNPRGFISGATLQECATQCGVFLLAFIVTTVIILALLTTGGGT